MEGTWWRQRQDLDPEQEALIGLPFDGRYLIVGPPGCGKTNLLVLRAAFLSKSGLKNQLLLTFGGVLSAFIDTGKKELDSNQISTFHKWARKLCHERIPNFSKKLEEATRGLTGQDEFNATRQFVAEEFLKMMGVQCAAAPMYEALFVDEVQDLFEAELKAISHACRRVTIAGDSRQSIYHGDAMQIADALGFETKKLSAHYRIGKAIARVADKLQPPAKPDESLEATTNYDESTQQSRAEYLPQASRQAQFNTMLNELRQQRRAYPKEALAILIPRRAAYDELRAYFSGTDLEGFVAYHQEHDPTLFSSGAQIHVMTVAGAKGTEFRAVHLFACEDAQGPQDTAEFWYTAVTRAKTTLLAYSSPGNGSVSPRLRSAFAQNENPTIDDLFE
ncbi:AAA family ATPase [Cupriavidus agavae]|uniref:AAA family ATPase n=1 Tax=Cupriavidus agavae TaxID=1001822 RepID=UPI0013001B15|nr:AAA family ATPase [Cupriavidus agavae]